MTPQAVLTQPLTLPCGAVIPNRLGKSAMSERLGTFDNRATPELARLYGRWADGGLGLSITGNVMIDGRALGEPNNVVVEDDSGIAALRAWAQAGTRKGCQLWMQLNHPGKQSPKGLNRENVSPSALPFAGELARFFDTPRELRVDEINDLIHRFGRSAALAQQAGFSGVQIHGAHGYLISQFLSPRHNQRNDDWGGSAAKRRRFVLEVYAEMRRQVGAAFPIGIKLNSADFQRGGFSEEESLQVIQALAAAGIDLVEISGGTYEAPVMTGVKASTREREAYFIEFSEKVRAAVKVPLMLTGGFRTADGMAQAVRSGAIDLVGLARPLALDPELPARLLAGESPQYRVRPITTGIKAIDRAGLMEITWYTRQLRRLGAGKNPRANESALCALAASLAENGWSTFKTRRLRA